MTSLHPLSRERAVTHKQGCNLRPQPSPCPPAAFKPDAQHEPAKGNMTRGSERVWFDYYIFFLFLKTDKTQPLSAIRNTHFIRQKLPAVFFQYNMWTRVCEPAPGIYFRRRAGSLQARRAKALRPSRPGKATPGIAPAAQRADGL